LDTLSSGFSDFFAFSLFGCRDSSSSFSEISDNLDFCEGALETFDALEAFDFSEFFTEAVLFDYLVYFDRFDFSSSFFSSGLSSVFFPSFMAKKPLRRLLIFFG
jgi:hypothetical protein